MRTISRRGEWFLLFDAVNEMLATKKPIKIENCVAKHKEIVFYWKCDCSTAGAKTKGGEKKRRKIQSHARWNTKQRRRHLRPVNENRETAKESKSNEKSVFDSIGRTQSVDDGSDTLAVHVFLRTQTITHYYVQLIMFYVTIRSFICSIPARLDAIVSCESHEWKHLGAYEMMKLWSAYVFRYIARRIAWDAT